MIETDVTIIGGGPIGATIAEKISKQNYKVILIEKNKKIGQNLQCAGIVTSKIFDYTYIEKKEIIQNKIKGARIHSPSNHVLEIGGGRTHALVIDRQLFDKKLIESAEKQGSKIITDEKLIDAESSDNQIKLKTNKNNSYKTKILIGADGALSNVRKHFKLSEPKEKLIGVGAEIKNTKLDPDYVEIFVGNKIAPGFFAWIIPTNNDGTQARIGLCKSEDSSHTPNYFFNHFLKQRNTQDFFKNIKVTKKIAGVIPLDFLKKTYKKNVMIVGDAASQVKPTSGGGIYTGLVAAECCSETALSSLQTNDFSSKKLFSYQKNWTSSIGKEIKIGLRFRKMFKSLKDDDFDKYIQLFQNEKIVNTINECGDIDFPSKLVKPLLKTSPSLVRFLPKLLK